MTAAGAGWWVFRVVVALHLIAVIGQPVFAGIFLSGDRAALAWHEIGADVATGFGYAQLVIAIVLFVRHRVRWVLPISIVLAVAETLQYYVGKHGPLWVHIPLGVAIVVILVMQCVAVWRRPSAKRLPSPAE